MERGRLLSAIVERDPMPTKAGFPRYRPLPSRRDLLRLGASPATTPDEEREVLHPNVLRDDVITADPFGG